jgi:hypothetical protein
LITPIRKTYQFKQMKQFFFIQIGIRSKKHVAIIALLFICISPVTVFSQEQQQEEQQPIEQPTVDTRPVDNNNGTLNSSPWPSTSNSASDNNAAAGSVDRYSNTGSAARPVTGGTAQRPAAGGTVTAGSPGGGGGFDGGNPDVPFDDNMNLAFLVVGLVFAFVVYKKRFASSDKASLVATKK